MFLDLCIKDMKIIKIEYSIRKQQFSISFGFGAIAKAVVEAAE